MVVSDNGLHFVDDVVDAGEYRFVVVAVESPLVSPGAVHAAVVVSADAGEGEICIATSVLFLQQ